MTALEMRVKEVLAHSSFKIHGQDIHRSWVASFVIANSVISS